MLAVLPHSDEMALASTGILAFHDPELPVTLAPLNVAESLLGWQFYRFLTGHLNQLLAVGAAVLDLEPVSQR